ncbi:MAG: DNA methyltransferase [Candidatus Helarchaeota archaeon]
MSQKSSIGTSEQFDKFIEFNNSINYNLFKHKIDEKYLYMINFIQNRNFTCNIIGLFQFSISNMKFYFPLIEIIDNSKIIFALLYDKTKLDHNFYKELLKLRDKLSSEFYIFFIMPDCDYKNVDDLGQFFKYLSLTNIENKIIDYKIEKFKNLVGNISYKFNKIFKSGLPIGKISPNNKLNELSGRDWIKFTKTWFVHSPPSRKKDEILHPAKFPESLIEDFIKFFTKENQLVIDPFLGSGSTLIASFNTKRSCIGIEIMKKYCEISSKRLKNIKKKSGQTTLVPLFKKSDNSSIANIKRKNFYRIIKGDSREIKKIWIRKNFEKADFCITSPPYWNQLKRSHIRQSKRSEMGLDTKYGDNLMDIGNIDDYNSFIQEQKTIFDNVYDIMKNKAYLVIITNNVFYNGRLYPLAFDTLISLSNTWVPKDEKIWCQDDKVLIALGIYSAWVGNRCHQYCLIFRKEDD